MKHLFGAVCLILVLSVVCAAQLVPPFIHGPYSGAPGGDSVTISWLLPASMTTTVTYARSNVYQDTGGMIMSVAVPASTDSKPRTTDVQLDGLVRDTAYVYQVLVQSGSQTIASPIGYFRTAPVPGGIVSGGPVRDTRVRFAVLADTQWQWDGPNRLVWVGDAIARDAVDADGHGIDFILHGGDLVESPSSYYWKNWFSSFENMLLVAPFIPVLGNHEKNHRTYYEYFAHPPGGGKDGERWWSLHWGEVVVVGIDTNVRSVADIKAQQDWLEQELSGSETHKFVIFHHPVFSSDAYHGSGYSYDVIYHPIFVKTGVDIVFNGHAHNYERIMRDGVTYLVVGGGGATPTAMAETRVDGSIVATTDHNFYAMVETCPDRIDVRVVSVDRVNGDTATLTPGETLDAFSLPSAKKSVSPTAAAPLGVGWIVITAIVAIGIWALVRGGTP
jgi:predicted phosphodiesterase